MKMTKSEALAALDALYKSGEYRQSEVANAIRFVSITGIVPDWLENWKPNKWYVSHNGREYETMAVSERDAINNIRFSLYGRTAECNLPPFSASCPFDLISSAVRSVKISEGREDEEKRTTTDLFGRHTISKQEAINRMKKMMRKAS